MAEPIRDDDEIKKRAARRLIVAVGLVGIAAGILTWLSHHKPAPPVTRPAPETAPPPIIAAEPPAPAPAPTGETAEPAPPAPSAPPAPERAATGSVTPGSPPPPPPPAAKPGGLPPTLGAPPPPRVTETPSAPSPGPHPPAVAPARPLVKAEAAPPPTPAHAPTGYVVQFGVFSRPENALQLVERLRAAGIDAQTETRVMLPPFKTRKEAEAAVAKLREKGISAVVVAR